MYQAQHTFLNYYKDHPGLEHKAGVPKGGTFVIVYYEIDYYRTETALLNREVETHVDIAKEENLVATEAVKREYYLDNDSIMLIRNFVENCDGATDDNKQKIIDIINRQQPPVDTKFGITNGTVIADFYIPYLCCSDCAPIAYIIESPDVQFDITPKTFLFDDAHNYPFITKPMVTNANIVQKNFPPNEDLKYGDNLKLMTDENNILYLHPAMELESTLHTTATYKNIDIPITIIVPDASFTINATKREGGVHLQVTAKNQDAQHYEWSVTAFNKLIDVTTTQPYQIDFDLSGEVQEFTIQFIITYVVNDNTSSDTKIADVPKQLVDEKINSGEVPFEPEYKE